MNYFIKPKSMNYNKLHSYISIIGLGPCMFYQLLFEGQYKDIKDLCQKFNIKEFSANDHLDLLQAAKLIQISIVDEKLYTELLPALSLSGSFQEKWDQILEHKLSVTKGSNISKTYYDIFDKKIIKSPPSDNWVTTFEKEFNKKIDASALISIHQVQSDNNFDDVLINQMLIRTKSKCQTFNANYFNLIAKTFAKLKIQDANSAIDFFNNNFFDYENKAQEYLEQLEKTLVEMEQN